MVIMMHFDRKHENFMWRIFFARKAKNVKENLMVLREKLDRRVISSLGQSDQIKEAH